ncbi:hypothetical protein TTHERM_00384990 (macronuclear) [Tetrahymena thermophila SB210]|uniref:Uncharacterized protein n=1 Tax=Tetrahymena thermophila (strain SB210) TaxID=312017 RepID=Q23RJ3_TETTS|nr:hypothetical protein TTHERM_00384990 [Tetrahymena thermophila SB210]EAR99055.3 hypothetical protein TTHERM_00384990 [Tetrahymena thermophila SB210]|eukprot:XP_001019300.3 hypothetical protein TTHERM_00384990 [Tetrahymena thermophila SB210]
MSRDKTLTLQNKQARFQKDYVLENYMDGSLSEENDEEDQEEDQFIKGMKIQEKLIFDNKVQNSQKVQFESDQNDSDEDSNQIVDLKNDLKKKMIEKNMLSYDQKDNLEQRKDVDNLLKIGKKQAAKDSVVHKNQQKFNNQVDEQLKKQNLVLKKGPIKSGFDVIASTNQVLKKQYEESVRLEEYDQQFSQKEQKFIEMIDSLKFQNKKKELQIVQLKESLMQQQKKLNGDNYGQSQIFNVSVHANNSNILFNSSYYSNKFVTTLNQHSILGCRATSNFILKDNEENQKLIQSRIEDLKEQLEDQQKKQFHEETQNETLEFKIKEMQATKVVLQREIQNNQLLLKNYDTQLNDLSEKLEQYEKQESSMKNQCSVMNKFIAADEEQKKEFLNKRKGNYECYKMDIKDALQEHNQIQQQIEKATIQIEKMKLEIEELDYHAKVKRQQTQQSSEILSILENFDLLCDVFIYNDPSISNIMEIENAYELTNKKKVVGFHQPQVANNNDAVSQKQNKKRKAQNSNHNNADQVANSNSTNNVSNNNPPSLPNKDNSQIPQVIQSQTPNTQQLSALPPGVIQRIQSNFNSKDNSPSSRSKTKTNEENPNDQLKSKQSNANGSSLNKSFTTLSKEVETNQDLQKSKEGSQVCIEEPKVDQDPEELDQAEIIEQNIPKYKQGDIILRLTQFYAFHRNDVEKAVNQVIQTFKSYNNDHDTLKTRIVDLSIQKKNYTFLYKKYENELLEFKLIYGDIKQQEEEEELQKRINRRLNIYNDNGDQDAESKNLLFTNNKKNNFNEQSNEQIQAFDAQIFEGQLFLFLNESLFRISKTINSVKYIICYSELFKEDMDVQNYYFKNDLFQEIQDILKFSLNTKMIYQEEDVPFIQNKSLDDVEKTANGSNRQSITGDALRNQILVKEQMNEKLTHNQIALARSITQKYQKSTINKLADIKNIFLEKFSPHLKKHDKLDTLLELIRNDIVIMYFCSIEIFLKFTGDIKEKFMREYDVEQIKDDKQIENLYSYALYHLNELRDLGEQNFRAYLRRLINYLEYLLLHIYLQSDKVWYDIKAYDPNFFLQDSKKAQQQQKKKTKRTWREKLVSNKIKAYEDYLGLELEKNENLNASMGVLLKEQITHFLNSDGQKSDQVSDSEEKQFFEEKRDNLKFPKVAVKLEQKRKPYELLKEERDDENSTDNTNATSKFVENIFNQNETHKQEKQIVRIDKEKMKDELQRCIGIKKNFQRMIQEADLSALSKTQGTNHNSSYINSSSLKLTSASLVKTEENQSVHNQNYPFSKVFYTYKAKQFKQPLLHQRNSQVNQSLQNNKKEEPSQQNNVQKRSKRSVSYQQSNQNNNNNSSQDNLNQMPSTERKIKTSQETKKYEHKKQQSLPIIKNQNIQLSASQRNISKYLLPHQRHITNPSAQSIRYDPNSSRITDNKSEAGFTKKNSLAGIPLSEFNGLSSQGTLLHKGDSQQSFSKKSLNKQQIGGYQLEDLLGKQIINAGSEHDIIHSGILSDDFNKNKSIFPNIPSNSNYNYHQFANKDSSVLI